jgi:hypothetical protein
MADQSGVTIAVNQGDLYRRLTKSSPIANALARAAAYGGEDVAAYFAVSDVDREASNDLWAYMDQHGRDAYEFGVDGYGRPYARVVPPTGAASLLIVTDFVRDDVTGADDAPTYHGVGEVYLSVDAQDTRTALTVTSGGLAFAGGVASGFRSALSEALSSGLSRVATAVQTAIRSGQVAPGAGVEMENLAAGGAAATEAEVTVTVSEAALEAVGWVGMGTGLLLFVLTEMMKNFSHRLEIQNLTDRPLVVADPTVVTGALQERPPYVAGSSAVTLAGVRAESDESIIITDATYMVVNTNPFKGLRYFVPIQGDALSEDVFAGLDVPYGADNAIWITGQDTDPMKRFAEEGDEDRVLRIVRPFGDVDMVLTMSALKGDDDVYASTLSVVDRAKYGWVVGA